MLFAIRFTDKPGSIATREKYFESHVAWLGERRESILVAGSLKEDLELNPVGALWIVEAEDKNAATEIFKTDPFWTNGMREKVEIYHWSKAFDEKTPV